MGQNIFFLIFLFLYFFSIRRLPPWMPPMLGRHLYIIEPRMLLWELVEQCVDLRGGHICVEPHVGRAQSQGQGCI